MKKKIISSLLALTLVVSASAIAMADGYVSSSEFSGISAFSTHPHPDACNGGPGGGGSGGGGGGGSDHLAAQDQKD